MAAVSSWLAPAAALLAGWLLIGGSRHGGHAGRLVAAAVAGVAGVGVWLVLLDMLGAGWSPASLAAGGGLILAAGAVAAVNRLKRRGHGADRGAPAPGAAFWAAGAGALVAAHAVVLAAVPSFGWDFRYIWGLKARVFAAAGGHAFDWLAWRPFEFARADYPPLWSDLVAAGVVLGGSAAAAAAAWTAVWALGVAAACWAATGGAPPPVRAAAAAMGAWMPVVFGQTIGTSGSAEPMTAFLTAVVVLGVVRAAEGRDVVPWPVVPLAAAMLALTKNEGMVLALAVSAAGVWLLPRRRSWPLLAAAAAAAVSWNVAVVVHAVPRLPLRWDPGLLVSRVWQLPGALLAAADWIPLLLVMALVAGLAGLRGRPAAALRLAFALWGFALLLAYVAGGFDIHWYVRNSLVRVVATPVPIVLSLALADAWRTRPAVPPAMV